MGVTINNNKQQINKNRTTALEWTAALASHQGCLNAFYWYQIFDVDSAVVKTGFTLDLPWNNFVEGYLLNVNLPWQFIFYAVHCSIKIIITLSDLTQVKMPVRFYIC